ncbi:MliC family protein [Sulfitobacter sp. F26204]|uniref:MliC family protein n=1 Tax=Sulfitobacter sp. F26204 TaxID=2996014 RepID=UPI00225E54EE|nr:MliC family protein [Sulfitobacter sp. F26204]MCX7559543.1 MliC family protein [Sulfitobacter sp. F26204]
MRITSLALALMATASAATAQVSLSIPLAADTSDSVQSQSYSCGEGAALTVQYVNSGANSLAILPLDGADRIFVNVVAASGAKYVSGSDVWWTKGQGATLENTLKADSMQNCVVD